MASAALRLLWAFLHVAQHVNCFVLENVTVSRPAIVCTEERIFCSFPNFKQWLGILGMCPIGYSKTPGRLVEEIDIWKVSYKFLMPSCSNVGNLHFWFLKDLLWGIMAIVLISDNLTFKMSTIIFTLLLCRWPYAFPCLLQHDTRNVRGQKFWPSDLPYFIAREVTIELLNSYPHRGKVRLGKGITIRIYFKT